MVVCRTCDAMLRRGAATGARGTIVDVICQLADCAHDRIGRGMDAGHTRRKLLFTWTSLPLPWSEVEWTGSLDARAAAGRAEIRTPLC